MLTVSIKPSNTAYRTIEQHPKKSSSQLLRQILKPTLSSPICYARASAPVGGATGRPNLSAASGKSVQWAFSPGKKTRRKRRPQDYRNNSKPARNPVYLANQLPT